MTAEADILERLAAEAFDLIMVDLMIRPESLDAEGNTVQNVHFPGRLLAANRASSFCSDSERASL